MHARRKARPAQLTRVERVVQRPNRSGRDKQLLLPLTRHPAYRHRNPLPSEVLVPLQLNPFTKTPRNGLYPRAAREWRRTKRSSVLTRC